LIKLLVGLLWAQCFQHQQQKISSLLNIQCSCCDLGAPRDNQI
jgi:hypothetical protein